MKKPLLSVVMGVYNGEKSLRPAVDSVLSQTFTDFEFIIVNDGSTDDSSAILKQCAVEDKRIRIIEQANAGLTKALMLGCEDAQGKYIARQDVGDFSYPARFEKQMELFRTDPRLVFVSCHCRMLAPDNEIMEMSKGDADPVKATEDILAGRRSPVHSSVIFSKEAYDRAGGYREEFYYGQDLDLWLRLARIGLLGYVQEVLADYGVDAGGLSFSDKDLRAKYLAINRKINIARENGQDEAVYLEQAVCLKKEILSEKRISCQNEGDANYFIGSCLLDSGNKNAVKYLVKAIKMHPFNFKILYKLIRALRNK